ncbi:MAG TPA: hypothetical protein PKI03_29420 [Pseudomonadota bacterium]|nr:hypothetical protein [Pseudomonadota bacterium]
MPPLPASRIACLRLAAPPRVGQLDALHDVASSFSPQVERVQQGDEAAVCLEVGDLRRLYPSESDLVAAMAGLAAELELPIWIAIAGSKAVAQIRARTLSPEAPTALIPTGWERSALSPLPLTCLQPSAEQLDRMHMWGLRSVGDLARLPRSAVAARLGKSGLGLHELACGESRVPLYPSPPPPEVNEEQSLLDPISDLEPLLFVFRGLLDRVLTRLRARSAACGGLSLSLHLTEVRAGSRLDRRAIAVAAPTARVSTLLDLVRLSLESQPTRAAIERIVICATPADPRPVQLDLFAPAGPAPDRLATTLARLQALCGIDRVGPPRLANSYLPGAAEQAEQLPPVSRPPGALAAEPPADKSAGSPSQPPLLSTHVLRPALPASVSCRADTPVRLEGPRFVGEVRRTGGPYRFCQDGQTHDYFDIELDAGPLLRLRHDLNTDGWFIDAVYD